MKEELNEQVSIKLFVDLLWSYKLFLVVMTVAAAVISVFYSLSLPNIFKSTTSVEHVRKSENDLSGAAQLGQLANLAGLSLGSGQSSDNKLVDIATIQSYDFLSEFILKNDVLIPLFAAESWEPNGKKLALNEEIYDSTKNEWVRPVKPPFTAEPSLQESVAKLREILTVEVDRGSGLVMISIDFISPDIAYVWLKTLVAQFNEYVRKKDIYIFDKHLEYLTERASDIQNQEIRNVLFSLIEQEQKKAMLANVSEDYVFRTIESPVAPQKKDSPRRALICASGTAGGFVFAVFLIFFRQLLRED